jgi:hypothetical protein
MTNTCFKFVLAAVGGLAVSGCADGTNGLLSTAAITPGTASTTTAAKFDPACVALSSRIDALRKDGVVDRVEKAAAGTGKSVTVKRESLVKIAELDKANAEFQRKCSVPLPASAAVPVAPAAAKPTVSSAAPATTATKSASAAAATTAKAQ